MNVPELHITPLVRLCAPQAILTRRVLFFLPSSLYFTEMTPFRFQFIKSMCPSVHF